MNADDNIVHENIEAAKQACMKYLNALQDLQEQFGVQESCDDSCAQMFIKALYRNETGQLKTLSYSC